MVPASPAEMLMTLQSKTWRLPILTGTDQVRLVMFKTVQFAFKYSRFVYMACQEVMFRYLTKTSQEVLPYKMVTKKYKMGSVSSKS